jgi:outer membrane biosynthesis protein TonB
MSRRFVILVFLCACTNPGCESPKRSQTSTITQEPEQPEIIPHIAAIPSRKPLVANEPNPVFGNYDSALIKAVQKRWEELLSKPEHPIEEKTGQVVVKFKLHADGSISDIVAVESPLGPQLTELSKAAIAESAPFGPWPDEMKRKVEGDFRELTFTFRYY